MPLGVKIISLLNMICGFAFGIIDIELLFSESLAPSLGFLLFSIPCLIVGFSFYKGKRWGWIFAIVSYTVGIVATIISANIYPDGLIGVVISILIVAYLNMSHVKAYFAKSTIIIEH